MIFKLLMSLLIIVGVGATGVVATQALVSDEVTLTANTYSVGSIDLKINTGKTSGEFEDSKTGFTGTLLPGETVVSFIRLKNNDGDTSLSIAAQATDIIPTTGITANDVDITFTAIDTDTAETPVGDAVTKTLAEWETVGQLGLPNIDEGDTQRYKMVVKIHDSVTQPGASISFNLVFTGTQVVSSPL